MSAPSELIALERAVEAVGASRDIETVLQHQSIFHAVHAAIDRDADPAQRHAVLAAVERLVPPDGLGRVFVLSFLVAVSGEARFLRQLQETLARRQFTLRQRHFFYWQLITRHSHLRGLPELEPSAVYATLLAQYRRSVNLTGAWIEPADRDADAVVVMTNQLLGRQHAPTADCLDYCHVLQARLGKRVLLISTADMPWAPALPYYDANLFNRVEEYSMLSRLEFRGETFDFYQCRTPMPNLEELRAILSAVRARRPSCVLSLGHSNVTADLCSAFVTVATMPFGTDLPRASSNVFVLPRCRRPDDAAFMHQWRIADEQIVEAEYTFRLPERTASLTRAELGLPADAYVIAIVGNRLGEEVTNAVADDLAALLSTAPQVFLAFAGTFPTFERLAQRHPVFATRSRFLGYQRDMLAVYACCDGYLNPPRYGGGSSAAFALAMGLPVMTAPVGDVANIAGPRFVMETPAAVSAFVRRSCADQTYRQEWAEAARARFDEISDREGMLRRILEGVAARASIRRELIPSG